MPNKLLMPESKIDPKELDLIQAVITRMAANSFEVKKWMLAVLAALIAIQFEEFLSNNWHILLATLVPVLGFWVLDAFFLKTERLYRELYKWVIENRPKTDAYLYDLNTFKRTIGVHRKDIEIPSQIKVMFSQTLLIFYLTPIVILLLLFFL